MALKVAFLCLSHLYIMTKRTLVQLLTYAVYN